MRNVLKQAETGRASLKTNRDITLSEFNQLFKIATTPPD